MHAYSQEKRRQTPLKQRANKGANIVWRTERATAPEFPSKIKVAQKQVEIRFGVCRRNTSRIGQKLHNFLYFDRFLSRFDFLGEFRGCGSVRASQGKQKKEAY